MCSLKDNFQNRPNSKIKRNTTIRDVALRAGVSPSTVGRVMGGYGYASENTKKKVLKIAKQMNYHSHIVARSLKTGKNRMIGYLVPSITNLFFSHITRGIQDVTSTYNYSLILCNTDRDSDRTRSFVRTLIESRVGGVIHSLPGGDETEHLVDLLRQHEIPVVVASGSGRLKYIDRVLSDRIQGARQATKHLIDLGHVDIGVIAVKNSTTSSLRLQGYRLALEEKGLEMNKSLVSEGSGYSEESGYTQMKMLLTRSRPPTAVLAFNDVMAVGALRAAEEEGLLVPQNLSVIGFDDTLASLTRPQLTSVALPMYEMGKVAAHILFDRLLKHSTDKPKEIILSEKLMVRDSTGPPRYQNMNR